MPPGGALAAANITAAGNFATDLVTGGIPDINSVEDAFGYVANSAMNALDVAGAGKIAKAGFNGLGKMGLNYLPDVAGNMASSAAADLADPMMVEWLSGWEKYTDGVTIVASRSYIGQLSTASLLKTGASAALGVHGHHSYPKYLGGDPSQTLTNMPASDHKQLHKDMNDFMRQQTDAQGNHMRPQRGNNKYKIQKNFNTQQREQALKDFYRGSGAKYKRAAKDFFKQVSRLR